MPLRPFSHDNAAARRYARANDAELIADCLAGKAPAWDALIERYEALIYSVPVRMGLAAADADDVFQNVCLLLLNHLSDLRDTSRLAGWLALTTRRETWRLQRRRGAASLSEIPDREWEMEAALPPGGEAPPSLEAEIIALEEQQLVRQGMQRLADRCRRLLSLLYTEDPPRSYDEAARELGMPVGSIGPNRARCLQRLQKILDELGF